MSAETTEAVYGVEEIKKRYGVGKNKAYSIIKAIEYVNHGLAISPTKVLPSELEYYERNRGRIGEELPKRRGK